MFVSCLFQTIMFRKIIEPRHLALDIIGRGGRFDIKTRIHFARLAGRAESNRFCFGLVAVRVCLRLNCLKFLNALFQIKKKEQKRGGTDFFVCYFGMLLALHNNVKTLIQTCIVD